MSSLRHAASSTLLWLMSRGMSLSQCAEYTEERIRQVEEEEGARREAGQKTKMSFLNKKPDEVARILVNGCAQYSVAERLAEEWHLLGSEIRMKFTDLANAGRRSGNKDKGLLRADKMLGGKIFRREYAEESRVLKERDGKTYVSFQRARDESRYATGWKFAALPPDYHKWSPARKKVYREQMARERRAAKS